MYEYIKLLFKRAKDLNDRLNNTALLQGKTWVRVTAEGANEKWFFKPNKELIISVDGNVTEGSYDFVNEYMIIKHLNDSILVNQSFLYNDILMFNKDDDNSEIYAFFDASKYTLNQFIKLIETTRKQELNIKKMKLLDNSEVEIVRKKMHSDISIGNTVLVNRIPSKDDFIETHKNIYKLRNGVIKAIYFKKKYNFYDTNEVIIMQEREKISEGDKVISSKFPLKNGEHKININEVVLIEDSIIKKKYHIFYVLSLKGKRLEIWSNNPKTFNIGNKVYVNREIAPDGKYILQSFNLISVKDGLIEDKL